MGTLSKRPWRDFGVDVKRIEDFRTSVGGKVAHRRAAQPIRPRWLRPATYLALAGASFLGAVALKALGRNQLSLLVGQWVPTFLILGLYLDRSPAGFR